ncbi:aspartate-semialdehyde dehydrogenase [Chlamydia trachomatis]|uniref:Aspartate semialdehyde dehydrogenase n=1 Tax=Chlamydia trachomatis serovar D (strain ATCC VR-885 / DSM 19411 / UW-3/Cx) TaxID=272561 RepID=O84368_CHLTR|nr:aspartate-semialdehyde dehydrogenase [Chlamydia trachomatis]NP_219872.1 aspartate-semialdehyde dehydrogenase [Chlamydia trachomatis D/UW-3/CX]AAC67959.1 Aspartate semialdehyde dehydrogenase [Chlamydia trachomatis D/UW-3/CX]ADH18058.1 aspartate-semialdehyde dehydrogenase [Chlamydia trachomatis G/9768]ADH18980.1 aspartate-semialdehyde dehydrogenase [Chlamydia trachomatis G/11222]ADH19905.1 aspartate-semialdehyde dehydrogenase [Chlamydia trachomatis G/11074]ADH97001.1 aspartate-semialdehyde d
MTMRIAILGATGLVGQKLIALLQNHKQWEIAELGASSEKHALRYESACLWQEPLMGMPESVRDLSIRSVEEIESNIVVSCLPSSVAFSAETTCLSSGKIVFSNATAYRMHKAVPILIPEINSDHLSLLEEQPFLGKIITNSNCCVSGIALALKPLLLFNIEHVHVITLQSASGAGYPGVSSLDLIGNTVPYILGEEEKILRETVKILGQPGFPAEFSITASVHRVPVAHGHVISVHVMFDQEVDLEEITSCYEKDSATYVLYDSPWHPQVRKDLAHDDMRLHIGPISYGGNTRTIKMCILLHNLVRGAAGALIANMNLFRDRGGFVHQERLTYA